jgi:hypothetical protein
MKKKNQVKRNVYEETIKLKKKIKVLLVDIHAISTIAEK